MHAAERALRFTKRNIALHQPWIETARFELPQAPTPSEKASVVLEFFWLYYERTWQLCRCENHGVSSEKPDMGQGQRAKSDCHSKKVRQLAVDSQPRFPLTLQNCRFRNRRHKLTAPLTDVRILFHHLGLEVPG